MRYSASVLKAFDVLNILTGYSAGLRLSELAAMLNLPRTNVLRLLESAQAYGLVRRDGMR